MISNVLLKLGLIKKKPVSKTLTVVTHIEPVVSLHPIKVTLRLCADYYNSSWSPEDGMMFGKKYPGIALGWGLQVLEDAREYARSYGYHKLVVERLLYPGVTEPILDTTF